MREVSMEKAAALIAEQLPTGAFLCVGGDTPNVMTIGWGGLTYYWKKHVFVAPVRRQRHTYAILEKQGCFTVCVPAPGTMLKAIGLAGSLSGRDVEKFSASGLTQKPGTVVDAPVVEGCALYLECITREAVDFSGEHMDPEIAAKHYPQADFHTLFHGEIVACYAEDM